MSTPDRWMKLAKWLYKRRTKELEQETLRRAVSTAYYALFHLLATAGARLFAPTDGPLAAVIAREFKHEEMKRAAGLYKKDREKRWPKRFAASGTKIEIPDELELVASTFIALQVARHEADYDLGTTYRPEEVEELLDRAEQAFGAWERIRETDPARLFLGYCLLRKEWDQPPRSESDAS
jgi:uncharacterized protein (UPF0332 family)